MSANVPQDHICCFTASVEPVGCTKRNLLFHSRVMKCMVYFGSEGAEQRHLANLAVLVKDIIPYSCLFFSFSRPPFCKRLLPPQHKLVEQYTSHTLPTWVQNLESSPNPFHEQLRNLHCSRRGAGAQPALLTGWEDITGAMVLSCTCQRSWCRCLHPTDQLLTKNLQGQRKTSFKMASTCRPFIWNSN